MHGLVSLLPQPFYGMVEALWQELDQDYGLIGIRITPYPHFSWQIADHYDLPALEQALGEIAKNSAPFKIRTTGLGLFTGPRPVLFIPVVKDTHLMDFHLALWQKTEGLCSGRSPLYGPEHWMPHISLAYEDLGLDNIAPVMKELTNRVFTWEMQVDNLTYIHEPSGNIGDIQIKVQLGVGGDMVQNGDL